MMEMPDGDLFQAGKLVEDGRTYVVLRHRNPKTGELGDLAVDVKIPLDEAENYATPDNPTGASGYLRKLVGAL